MNTAPSSSTLQDDRARIAEALRAEQLRLYDANLLPSIAANVLVAALLVTVQWGTVTTQRLLAWSACVALVLGARVLVWFVQRRRRGQQRDARARLLWLRLAVAGTGLVWGLAGVALFAAHDLQHQVFLAFVLAGVAAASLTITAFDLAVALTFAGLALAPLSVRLFASGESVQIAMANMVLLFMSFLVLSGLRAYRNLRETMALRSAESARTDTLLRSQQRLQELSEQLTRKTQALELTLDSMEQGILSFDADGRASVHNRRMLELTELPESFLAQRPTLDQIAQYQSEHGHYGEGLSLVDGAARVHFARWLAGEQPSIPEIYFRKTLSGRMLEVKTRHQPAGGMVRTYSDVTAYFEAQERLKASEAQARKLALVAAHTDNAVLITDAKGRIEWINESYTRLTGYKLDEVAGRSANDVARGPETDRVEEAKLTTRLLHEHRASGELTHYRKDGQPYVAEVDSHAIVDAAGRFERFVLIGRDISARKSAEAALRAARDEAERANRSKSEFLSAMSHELRTPMNAILGFGQLLESDPALGLPEGQKGYVREILRAGEHLLELINDVLDLARIEAGKQEVRLEPVQVSTLVDECLSLMQPVAGVRGIGLREAAQLPDEHFVIADRTRLKQVLLNLLSNAIKYNRAGGSVQVTCETDADALRISVSDTGNGLSPEQCQRLFRAFERLGAESGTIEGAGIGLVLCRRLVDLMQGSIGLHSVVDQGSTFWVRLARAQPQSMPAAHPVMAARVAAAAPSVDRSSTVLYIEDDPVNTLLMEAMVGREPGVRLITAPLPELGLELAHAAQPDLILLDIQLPGMDGFEVLRRLRAADSTRAIPVIAISANAMRGDIEHGLAAGFNDYLTKPIEMSRLLGVLRTTLRHGAAAEQLHEVE